MMLDWNAYQKQIISTIGEIGKLSPGTVHGYAELSNAGSKTGAALVFSARVMDAYASKASS